MRTTTLLLVLASSLVASSALAHEVVHEVRRGEAVVVTFATADGIPLAYEDCEVRAVDEDMPLLRGKTDVEGRVAFVPDAGSEYVVRVFASDGHGAQVRVKADAGSVDPSFASPSGATPIARLALGALLIVAMFLGLGRLARARS